MYSRGFGGSAISDGGMRAIEPEYEEMRSEAPLRNGVPLKSETPPRNENTPRNEVPHKKTAEHGFAEETHSAAELRSAREESFIPGERFVADGKPAEAGEEAVTAGLFRARGGLLDRFGSLFSKISIEDLLLIGVAALLLLDGNPDNDMIVIILAVLLFF